MRASTLLLITFILWLTAKKRLGKYWELATTNNSALAPSGTAADVGPGGDLHHATSLPGFNTGADPFGILSNEPIDRAKNPLPPLTELD